MNDDEYEDYEDVEDDWQDDVGINGAARIATEIDLLGPRSFGGSIAFFGDVLGGRVDNHHTLIGARASGLQLILQFDYGIEVRVWRPQGAVFHAPALIIAGASKIRLESQVLEQPDQPEPTQHIHRTEYVVNERAEVDVRTDWTARIPRLWQFGRKTRYRLVPGSALSKPMLGGPSFEIIDLAEYFSTDPTESPVTN